MDRLSEWVYALVPVLTIGLATFSALWLVAWLNEAPVSARVDSFEKHGMLACDGRILYKKDGWHVVGDKLVKDDRYYSLRTGICEP